MSSSNPADEVAKPIPADQDGTDGAGGSDDMDDTDGTGGAALESRYDRMADGYARWWGPVIAPAAVQVLDVLAPFVDELLARRSVYGAGSDGPRLLDVGSGTGTLAIAALERWPSLRVTGIDPSGGMLAVARASARERLPAAVADRYDTVVAPADALPFEDGAFDLAVSSFVLQLVPSKAAAMREIRRVLVLGGAFSWTAWLRSDRAYEPDRLANEVLDVHGFDPPEPDARPGDLASLASAALGMRRAGFRDVRTRGGELAHPWTPRGYVEFFTQFDEESLFAELDLAERGEIEHEILERLARLTADELTLRLPVVYVEGRAAR